MYYGSDFDHCEGNIILFIYKYIQLAFTRQTNKLRAGQRQTYKYTQLVIHFHVRYTLRYSIYFVFFQEYSYTIFCCKADARQMHHYRLSCTRNLDHWKTSRIWRVNVKASVSHRRLSVVFCFHLPPPPLDKLVIPADWSSETLASVTS